ncbi:uncharacterized protein MELLADRAFT_115056 [Melampsora larici-populina 98AG31]|uniref:MINDY deubiquitinase domain-containing protein n=1 Tax=Melampsora larici-populina (strain 98AG31 / pathotype 3-4-7) TaxID=747676 RepID=F4R6X5_MELLP|nr:uncharacterized protein MELLADRAFT_115056 [Melampsora larici-populina 98AG31]EGG12378.1 hypothetical protein MELLADRAFT_115056 [Melampsora larici-populina 98AG31]
MSIITSTEPTNLQAEDHSVITPATQDESPNQISAVSITNKSSSDAVERITEPQPLPSAVEESEPFSENERLPLPTPSTPSRNNQACAPSTSSPNQTDERWLIKKILWPPFPPSGSNPKSISIIMQNTNGPCSLLAVCNILLLQGSIVLPGPPDRTSISFQTLSSVLADYLVRHSADPTNLSVALSVIPSSRTGLNLNPRFGSIDGFGPGSGELALFSSAGVPLVHGWVADPQDQDTWDALMKCGDYDRALQEEEYRNQESRIGVQPGPTFNSLQPSLPSQARIQQVHAQSTSCPQVLSETSGTSFPSNQQCVTTAASTHGRRASHGSGQRKKNCIIM